MLKKFLPVLSLPLLLAGCTTVFTNLTPQQQERTPQNSYTVEVALDSRRQTMRWESIHPQIVIGKQAFPMRLTPLMTNRWEGEVQLPPGTEVVHYHYKFDFDYNSFGAPKQDSATSRQYTLRILNPQNGK
jgi:hypothetical protein